MFGPGSEERVKECKSGEAQGVEIAVMLRLALAWNGTI